VPRGRTKARITVAVEPGIARALDEVARGRSITRSAAVEEAVEGWLRGRIEEQGEALDRLSEKRGLRNGEGPDSAAGIAAWMVLEALRYQFPAMRDLSDSELRWRAAEARRRASGGA
jgi:predicted transcriptional regulator